MISGSTKSNVFSLSYKKDEVETYKHKIDVIRKKKQIPTIADAIKYSIRNTYEAVSKPDLIEV